MIVQHVFNQHFQGFHSTHTCCNVQVIVTRCICILLDFLEMVFAITLIRYSASDYSSWADVFLLYTSHIVHTAKRPDMLQGCGVLCLQTYSLPLSLCLAVPNEIFVLDYKSPNC